MLSYQKAESEFEEAVWCAIEDGRAALARLGIDQWQGPDPSREAIAADIAAGRTRVALDEEGKVAGTLMFAESGESDYANVVAGKWLTDFPAVPTEGLAAYATIHRVAVDAGHTRQGVSRFLFARAIDEARSRGFRSVRVDTHAGNIPMQSALAKAGFTQCCEIMLTIPDEPTPHRLGFELVLDSFVE